MCVCVCVCAKNISWPWLFSLQGWGSLTMALTGKFVYMYIYMRFLLYSNWQCFLIHQCSLIFFMYIVFLI